MRRRLGQHFLFDPSILERIVNAAHLKPEDIVVEIGPGKGRLTRMLAERAAKVIAIEYDPILCEELLKEFSRVLRIEIHCQDVLKYPFHELPPFKVVANIPYYITTPIIFKLLHHDVPLISATLTVQKEVAERIIALPGRKDYGVLSLMVQYYTEPEIVFNIPRKAFVPPPKVDSSVIHLRRREHPPVSVANEQMLFKVIKTAFSKRRKTLANSLKPLRRDIKELLVSCGIDPVRRPETLSMDEFAKIANLLSKQRRDKDGKMSEP